VSLNGIPQSVIDFLAEQIDSVLELEVLLLLRASAPQRWCSDDLAAALKIDAAWADQQLEKFVDRAILARDNATPLCYTYAPANPPLDDTIRAVADAYASHRVRIIGLIFSKPTSNLKSFADAFRIRKDKE
jgi:hypothetical protein